eukprot:TRINITY_DN112939_c0_g1_i1.p1 TRINITY_DN112939_c0_g1~~TRINITY_DN112939_c0_g1_i1.p1  ORF type:complete len:578 (+),score=79.15 TRINITY_DN112939_c0_g1_i1:73-1734(+)
MAGSRLRRALLQCASVCWLLFGVKASGVTVNTTFGKLIGSKEFLRNCEQFLGIPFAKPPVGDLRFEDPVPWDEAYPAEGLQATSYGKQCPQMGVKGDEDCLTLNIWRPKEGPREGLPTLVFIPGGGFMSGSSSSFLGALPTWMNLYDGCGFVARQSVIIAVMQYRLGPLGFTAFEDSGAVSGNFGMKDQRQALRWLQQELPAFGGDPAKITLFGESAGGISVFYHVASPASKGLFRAAISESGFPLAWSWKNGRNNTLRFAAHLNCTDSSNLKACLRKLPQEVIVNNMFNKSHPFALQTGSPPWQPCVDGIDMPRYPFAMFKDQETSNIPILAGHNTDELNLFVYAVYHGGMNESVFNDYLMNGVAPLYKPPSSSFSDADIADVLAAYKGPNSEASDKRALAAEITGDVSFQGGTYATGQVYRSDFWLYRFNHRSACQFWLKGLVPGVYHASELFYVWQAQAKVACKFSAEELDLSNRMQTMWANFAKCLDPMCGQDGFPKYSNSSRKALVFQTPKDEIEEDYRSEKRALWNRLVYDKYHGQYGGPSQLSIVV